MNICFIIKYILSCSLVIKSRDETAVSTEISEIRRLFRPFKIHISGVCKKLIIQINVIFAPQFVFCWFPREGPHNKLYKIQYFGWKL